MCGIFGEVGGGETVPISELSHRGPDDRGIWRGKGIVLGHCRLAIIDIEGGKQPWVEKDKALTYNGEIYNFMELRKELEAKGYSFVSRSDTEVLFKVLEEYGLEGIKKLDGMFAFGYWDGKRLLLAKDRFGVKPLYWVKKGGKFAFASEIKALLSLPWVPKSPNLRALRFHLSFLWNPYPETAFEGIFKLPPGHILIFEDGRVDVRSYYDPLKDYSPGDVDPEDVLEVLSESVKKQMIADVEVGIFLSGGVDSSAIAALTPNRLRAFTLRFKWEDLKKEIFSSEEEYARKVAELFGHTLLPVEVSFSPETFRKVVWHLEEPVGDGAAVSNFLLSEGVRKMGLKVALVGTGGDELWGGYPRYRALLIDKLFPFMRFLPDLPFSSGRLGRIARDIRKFKDAASLPFPLKYLRWMGYYTFQDTLNEMIDRFPKLETDLDSAMLFDILYFLPEHNLLYTDKTSMAHGVELRVPFLSNELLKLSLKTSSRLKVNFREGKVILKKALEKFLPKDVLHRKKAGFGAPVKGWLSGPLMPHLKRVENDPLIRQLLSEKEIEEVLLDNLKGKGFKYLHAYELLTLSVWREVFGM